MSNLMKICWSTGCRRCVVNDTSGVRTSCRECFPYCNTLLEKCSPSVFLFNIKTFKLIANFNKIWNIMFYAVFAAWSTRSYQDAGTADTGLTRSICMGFHNCYLDVS